MNLQISRERLRERILKEPDYEVEAGLPSRDERSVKSGMADALRDFIGIGKKPAKECEYFLRNKGYSGTHFGRIRTRAGVKTRKTRDGWVWRLSSPPAATPESVWLSWRR